MNTFGKCCNNISKKYECIDMEKRLIGIYYNLYNVGCGLELFAKGCKAKRLIDTIKNLKR